LLSRTKTEMRVGAGRGPPRGPTGPEKKGSPREGLARKKKKKDAVEAYRPGLSPLTQSIVTEY